MHVEPARFIWGEVFYGANLISEPLCSILCFIFLVFLAHKCWVCSEVCRVPNWILSVLFLYSTNLQIITIHGVLLVFILIVMCILALVSHNNLWTWFYWGRLWLMQLLRQNSAASCSLLRLSFKLCKPNISFLSGQQTYAKTFLQHSIWIVSSLPQRSSLMVHSWDSLLSLFTSMHMDVGSW